MYSRLSNRSTGSFPFTRPKNGRRCVFYKGAFVVEKNGKHIFPSIFVNPGPTETINISKRSVNYMGKQNMTSKVAYLNSFYCFVTFICLYTGRFLNLRCFYSRGSFSRPTGEYRVRCLYSTGA